MTAKEILLKRQQSIRLYSLACKLAETRIDAVDGGPGRHQVFQAAARLFHALANRGRRGQLSDRTREYGRSIIDFQGITQPKRHSANGLCHPAIIWPALLFLRLRIPTRRLGEEPANRNRPR